MASLSPSAGGQDAAATELDANLKAAAFPELQRKCTELKLDFEPSIDSELAHIERRKDANKSRKKQLREALRQRVLYAIGKALSEAAAAGRKQEAADSSKQQPLAEGRCDKPASSFSVRAARGLRAGDLTLTQCLYFGRTASPTIILWWRVLPSG